MSAERGKRAEAVSAGSGSDVDGTAAAETARALGEERGAAVPGDVRDREAISRALDVSLERFDKVTHLVNAAGVTAHAGLFEITEEEGRLWQTLDTLGRLIERMENGEG